MKVIWTISTSDIILINKNICFEHGHRHQCFEVGKIESALHSTFYPGSSPFQHGGIANLAGVLAYYLTMAHAFFDGNKRTAVLASTIFLDLNGWQLNYQKNPDSLYLIVENCAKGVITKEEMMRWYDLHKKKK